MKTIIIAAAVAALVGSAVAAPTTFSNLVTINQELKVSNGQDQGIDSYTWNHTVPAAAVGNITDAYLTIDVTEFNASDDVVTLSLTLNSVTYSLANLTANSTTFDLSDYVDLDLISNPTPTTATLTFTWGSPVPGNDNIILVSSRLYGEYDDANPGPTNPVPAPGAILLAGIGTSVVGWLRRRQIL